jgi:hypothetical protein
MLRPPVLSLLAVLCGLVVACGAGDADPTPTPPPPTEAPPTATAMPSPTATPEPVRVDILATRLVIPSLEIDAPVQLAQTVPYTYTPPLPECPARPQDTDTLVVPADGIATPADNLEGLENKAWIFGHSRWLGNPGLFLRLQDIDVGDEVVIDGEDRATGEVLTAQRYVVDAIYLTDVDSGGVVLNAEDAADIPDEPIVVLQTSVREDGAGKSWILDQATLMAKAENLVEGDINDPCKYLLLFVVARPV